LCWLEACWCYVAGLAVGDVVSECRLVQPTLGYHITNRKSRYITPTRLKSAHYSLHNNAPSSRKLLEMVVLTSETCWAVKWHNKASVIKLVYLYSNISIFLCSLMQYHPARLLIVTNNSYLKLVTSVLDWLTSSEEYGRECSSRQNGVSSSVVILDAPVTCFFGLSVRFSSDSMQAHYSASSWHTVHALKTIHLLSILMSSSHIISKCQGRHESRLSAVPKSSSSVLHFTVLALTGNTNKLRNEEFSTHVSYSS